MNDLLARLYLAALVVILTALVIHDLTVAKLKKQRPKKQPKHKEVK